MASRQPPPDDEHLPPDPLYGPAPIPAPPSAPPGYPVSTTRRSHEERRSILGRELQQAAWHRLRVESATDYPAVLVQGQRVNHLLPAILTFFTCMLWGIVWIVLAATGGEKRFQLVVDEYGNVIWQNLG